MASTWGTGEASQRRWDWNPAGSPGVRETGPVSTKGTDPQGLTLTWGGKWCSSICIRTQLFCVLITRALLSAQ